ncbi:TRAP-T-associated universal stress protein TeaD [Saezia sanguinis]|uniref:TRAP-T-associated universal stress protein TeaD n=2 Tax=Saezia sanguinis TaxID=1965230 RepID=A0A433SAV2_9BURK|nr:TRAP-T-associated universal stress protein TeaD [Saezia sanguinis]
MFMKVLVPTDGSEASAKARQAAYEVAKKFNIPVVALYVMEPSPYVNVAEYANAARAEADQVIATVKEECKEQGIKGECVLLEFSHVDQGILEQAKEHHCDLIVMGTHGRRGLNRLLMGSVASNVLSQSKIPVLVIP